MIWSVCCEAHKVCVWVGSCGRGANSQVLDFGEERRDLRYEFLLIGVNVAEGLRAASVVRHVS